jgi:hypothetical protein
MENHNAISRLIDPARVRLSEAASSSFGRILSQSYFCGSLLASSLKSTLASLPE